MSLRRPRIKTAVNLSALANGRRKDKPPDLKENEEKASTSNTEVAEDAPQSVVGPEIPSKEPDFEVNTNEMTEKIIITAIDDVLISPPENFTETVNHNTGVQPECATVTHPVTDIEDRASIAIDAKPFESPFSPPPPVRAANRFKSRYRPNLDENRHRIRRYSGTLPDLGSPLQNYGHQVRKNRTISCSSASETEMEPEYQASQSQDEILMKKPPAVHRTAILTDAASQLSPTPLVSIGSPPDQSVPQPNTNDQELIAPKPVTSSGHPPRHRRITEARDSTDENRDPTVFEVRKADHKKKFTTGIPERTQLTMFDLIYYNPSTGSRMSNSSSLRSSRTTSRTSSVDQRRISVDEAALQLEAVRQRLEEEAVDDVEPMNEEQTKDPEEAQEEEDAMPVPQVKVGPDGSIIIDESSTFIETTAAKKAKEDYLKSPLVFENSNMATNYGSWGKRKKTVDWTEKETVRFFKALSIFGTDFSMMENIFKRRTRHELKMKYKKEEKQNRALVDKCLTRGLQFDASIMESEEDEAEEEVTNGGANKTNTRGRKRKQPAARNTTVAKKKRVPKSNKKRGFYSSSEEDEDHVQEQQVPQQNPVQRPQRRTRSQRNSINGVLNQGINMSSGVQTISNVSGLTPTAPSEMAPPPSPSRTLPQAGPSTSLLKNLLTSSACTPPSMAGVAFPPALLAANPSLANAAPGSLVVVASPSASVAGPQLLQVFVVGPSPMDAPPVEGPRNQTVIADPSVEMRIVPFNSPPNT